MHTHTNQVNTGKNRSLWFAHQILISWTKEVHFWNWKVFFSKHSNTKISNKDRWKEWGKLLDCSWTESSSKCSAAQIGEMRGWLAGSDGVRRSRPKSWSRKEQKKIRINILSHSIIIKAVCDFDRVALSEIEYGRLCKLASACAKIMSACMLCLDWTCDKTFICIFLADLYSSVIKLLWQSDCVCPVALPLGDRLVLHVDLVHCFLWCVGCKPSSILH